MSVYLRGQRAKLVHKRIKNPFNSQKTNDDFIKNQFVILGESRFHAFVKKLDEQAFIYDDIATIKTAITKP